MPEFCNGDVNKFVLLLRKCVYPYEYTDSWEGFSKTSLLDKKKLFTVNCIWMIFLMKAMLIIKK